MLHKTTADYGGPDRDYLMTGRINTPHPQLPSSTESYLSAVERGLENKLFSNGKL